MFSKIYRSVTVLLVIFLFGSIGFAQNENDAIRVGFPGLGSNARALGMGNSFISLSNDASASFYNPAGFGLIDKMEFSGGLDYLKFSNESEFFNTSTDYSNSSTNLNRVSFAFPIPTVKGSLVFGLSYHKTKDFTGAVKFDGFNSGSHSKIQSLLDSGIPFDLYLTDTLNQTPINGLLNQSGTILRSGSIDNWTLSAAIEVAKNLFIGANLNIISGNFKYDSDYYEDDTQNIYQGETADGEPQTTDFRTFYLKNILDWNIAGWNAKLGLIYKLNPYVNFGATIQFPKTFNIKEDFTVDGFSEFGTGTMYNLDTDFYSDKVEYDILTPFEFAAGFAIDYAGLIFAAEGTLIDYSQMEFGNAAGLSAQYISDINKRILELLRTSVNYNIGLEYIIPVLSMKLRAGYFLQQSPYKDDPSEFDRKYLTAGIGFTAQNAIGIDFAYAHGWWSDFGDNYGVNQSRFFQDITTDLVSFTITYHFN